MNRILTFKNVKLNIGHIEGNKAVADRIIEIMPDGIIDKRMTYEEYLDSEVIAKNRDRMYS